MMKQIDHLWETYRCCWSDDNSEKRAIRLNEILSNDFEYRDPNVELKGHGQLSEYMEQFQNEFKGASFKVVDLNVHHDRIMAKWNMINMQDEVIGNGIDFAQFESGKLKQITGFFI